MTSLMSAGIDPLIMASAEASIAMGRVANNTNLWLTGPGESPTRTEANIRKPSPESVVVALEQ